MYAEGGFPGLRPGVPRLAGGLIPARAGVARGGAHPAPTRSPARCRLLRGRGFAPTWGTTGRCATRWRVNRRRPWLALVPQSDLDHATPGLQAHGAGRTPARGRDARGHVTALSRPRRICAVAVVWEHPADLGDTWPSPSDAPEARYRGRGPGCGRRGAAARGWIPPQRPNRRRRQPPGRRPGHTTGSWTTQPRAPAASFPTARCGITVMTAGAGPLHYSFHRNAVQGFHAHGTRAAVQRVPDARARRPPGRPPRGDALGAGPATLAVCPRPVPRSRTHRPAQPPPRRAPALPSRPDRDEWTARRWRRSRSATWRSCVLTGGERPEAPFTPIPRTPTSKRVPVPHLEAITIHGPTTPPSQRASGPTCSTFPSTSTTQPRDRGGHARRERGGPAQAPRPLHVCGGPSRRAGAAGRTGPPRRCSRQAPRTWSAWLRSVPSRGGPDRPAAGGSTPTPEGNPAR